MLVSGELDEPGVGYVLGQVAAVGDARPALSRRCSTSVGTLIAGERAADVRLDDSRSVATHVGGLTDMRR